MNAATFIAGVCMLLGAGVLVASLIRTQMLFEAIPLILSKSREPVVRMLRLYRHLLLFIILGYMIVVAGLTGGLWNLSTLVIGAVFFFFAVYSLLCSRLQATLFKELEKTLHGLVPICVACKKIRTEAPNGKENWVPIEVYISERTDAQFTHGYCPNCANTVITEFNASKKK
ncbi:MAG: hypothetical protein AB7T27_09890 [Kiritimatiellia bacterium]